MRARPRVRRIRSALCLCLLLSTGLACSTGDPLEEIRAQQAAGDYAGTIEPLREQLAREGVPTEVYFLYGRALALTDQPNLAEWSLRKAMDDPEWVEPAGILLALGSLSSNNAKLAIGILDRVLEANPDNTEALLLRATAYTNSRLHHEEALADADRLEELDPGGIEAMQPRIQALLRLERGEEAAEAIEELGRRIEASTVSSEMASWHCTTAAIFAEENDQPELAAERWADCIERFPDDFNVVTKAVVYYDSVQDYDRSLEILQAAYAKQPESRAFRGRLAERLLASGLPKEGEAVLLEGTRSEDPAAAANAWLDLASFYQSGQAFGASATALGKAVELARELGEEDAELQLRHADALVLAGRLDEALAVAETMSLPAYREMMRARVAHERGQLHKALEHYSETFRLWPDNAGARYNAALAAEGVGDFERAVEEYRYALRLGGAPKTDASLRLARIYAAYGQLDLASTILRGLDHPNHDNFATTLLAVRVWARMGSEHPIRRVFDSLHEATPGLLAQAAAATADGLADRGGELQAYRLLQSMMEQGLDPLLPANADALRALVRYGHSTEPGEVEKRVRAALEAHPDDAALLAVQGYWLEVSGKPAEAEASYERALELQAGEPNALVSLGRLRLASDASAALALFQQAAQITPVHSRPNGEARHGAVDALVRLGRLQEARGQLLSLLEDDPVDASAAAQLAELDLEQGEVSARTLDMANRAARFGRDPEAKGLLARVREASGNAATQ
jgi:tetratricopeptide (TPR) repeat protein